MKKYTLLITIILIISFFAKIPKYNELNNIIIIDQISINCDNKEITLREINPLKEDNKITYKYKKYKIKTNNLKKINEILEKKYKKQFFYNKTNKLITNCNNINIIKDKLKLSNIKIKELD